MSEPQAKPPRKKSVRTRDTFSLSYSNYLLEKFTKMQDGVRSLVVQRNVARLAIQHHFGEPLTMRSFKKVLEELKIATPLNDRAAEEVAANTVAKKTKKPKAAKPAPVKTVATVDEPLPVTFENFDDPEDYEDFDALEEAEGELDGIIAPGNEDAATVEAPAEVMTDRSKYFQTEFAFQSHRLEKAEISAEQATSSVAAISSRLTALEKKADADAKTISELKSQVAEQAAKLIEVENQKEARGTGKAVVKLRQEVAALTETVTYLMPLLLLRMLDWLQLQFVNFYRMQAKYILEAHDGAYDVTKMKEAFLSYVPQSPQWLVEELLAFVPNKRKKSVIDDRQKRLSTLELNLPDFFLTPQQQESKEAPLD